MSDVIEKVARAIADAEMSYQSPVIGPVPYGRRLYPTMAKAAIAALADHFDNPPTHTVAFNSAYETTARRLRSLLKESK